MPATALLRSAALRVAVTKRMPSPRIGSARFLGIGDELKRKESVEEALYIKRLEQEFFEKKRAQKNEEEHKQELAVFEEVVAPAMVECQQLLKQSGDTVSDAGLELLAKWKLGIKK